MVNWNLIVDDGLSAFRKNARIGKKQYLVSLGFAESTD